jgi:hypothetical protein
MLLRTIRGIDDSSFKIFRSIEPIFSLSSNSLRPTTLIIGILIYLQTGLRLYLLIETF